MWLLNFFTDLLIHGLVVAGLLGTLVCFFVPSNPLISTYQLPLKIISIALLCAGIFFEGTIYKDNVWKARVAEAEKRVLLAEIAATKANGKIEYKIIEKIKVVRENEKQVQLKIKENANKIDANCVVIPEVSTILNDAATARKKVSK